MFCTYTTPITFNLTLIFLRTLHKICETKYNRFEVKGNSYFENESGRE